VKNISMDIACLFGRFLDGIPEAQDIPRPVLGALHAYMHKMSCTVGDLLYQIKCDVTSVIDDRRSRKPKKKN
jgi:hypothetical protein